MLIRFVLTFFILVSSASSVSSSSASRHIDGHDNLSEPSSHVYKKSSESLETNIPQDNTHSASIAQSTVKRKDDSESTAEVPEHRKKREIIRNAIRKDSVGVVPHKKLEKVKLVCPFGVQKGQDAKNILLIHGTDGQGEVIWAGGLPDAFHAKGYSSCWVDLPDRSLGDAQITSEYVVHSVKKLYHRSGNNPIFVIGHSQGSLNIQWGLNFFPSIRPMVANFVSLSGDFHGSTLIQYVVATQKLLKGGTAPSYIQQSVSHSKSSNFLKALNRHGDIALVPTTSTYGTQDQIVHDIHTSTELGIGGADFTHVAIQHICPQAFVDHFMTVIHRVSFYLALDAFEHGTAANITRVKANYLDICDHNLPPNVSNNAMAGSIAPVIQAVSSLVYAAPVPVRLRTKVEPELVPYAANQPRIRRLPRRI